MNKAPAYQREVLAEPLVEAMGGETPEGAAHRPRDHAVRGSGHGLWRSFQFAIDGFWYVVVTQRNFRLQLVGAVVAASAGFYFHISAGEWLAVLLASTLVLVLEMTNTAIESVVDMVTRDYHPLAKSAKDIAAAAVLVASIAAVVVAVIIFGPHLAAAF